MDKNQIEELRIKYAKNPPEGMSPEDIRLMSNDELLDMDYFLNENDDIFDDIDNDTEFDFEEIFSSDSLCRLFSMPAFCRLFSFICFSFWVISYYIRKKDISLPRLMLGEHIFSCLSALTPLNAVIVISWLF